MTRMRAPARPLIGTLGPLLQQPGLASHLGLRTPPRSDPSDCSCSCLAMPLGPPHAPGQNRSPDPGLGALLGSRPGSSLAFLSPLYPYLSVCPLNPLARSPFYLLLIRPVSPVSPCSTRCLSGLRRGQCLGSGLGITRTSLHRRDFTQFDSNLNAFAFLQLWTNSPPASMRRAGYDSCG